MPTSDKCLDDSAKSTNDLSLDAEPRIAAAFAVDLLAMFLKETCTFCASPDI